MAKEKEARRPFNLKREVKLLPGYIILLLWVIFTIFASGMGIRGKFFNNSRNLPGKSPEV